MNDALAFDWGDPDVPRFDPSLRFHTIEDILTICSSLVIISGGKVEGQQTSVTERSEVRLAHHSVKDYLLSTHLKDVRLSHFALEARTAHSIIAVSCLVYLLQFETRLDTATVERFPLARYAARYWPEHSKRCQTDEESLSYRLALQLLNTDEVPYKNCCSLYNPASPWLKTDLEMDKFPPVLGYACCNGLRQVGNALVSPLYTVHPAIFSWLSEQCLVIKSEIRGPTLLIILVE
jgi:hypothetical protein